MNLFFIRESCTCTFLLKTSTLQSYFKKYGRDQAYFYGLLSAIKYLNLLNLLIYWSILCTIKKYVLHLPKIPFRISAHSSSSSVNLCFIWTFDFSAMFSYILSQRCDQLSQSSVMERRISVSYTAFVPFRVIDKSSENCEQIEGRSAIVLC